VIRTEIPDHSLSRRGIILDFRRSTQKKSNVQTKTQPSFVCVFVGVCVLWAVVWRALLVLVGVLVRVARGSF
jgi:hypothetical protein